MKNLTLFFTTVVLFTACKKNAAPAEVEANWSSTDRYASWTNGGYTVSNDVWGSGYGPQTIWANTYSNWGVWANHPNTGGVKSYPNSGKNVNKSLSSLNTCTGSFNVTMPGSGAWGRAHLYQCKRRRQHLERLQRFQRVQCRFLASTHQQNQLRDGGRKSHS